jgi:hypothetical protein
LGITALEFILEKELEIGVGTIYLFSRFTIFETHREAQGMAS